jgi:hypothetical protein
MTDPPAKIHGKFPMMNDYWQSVIKVKKINQIPATLPLAGSHKNRNTETLTNVGRLPTRGLVPIKLPNPQGSKFDSTGLNTWQCATIRRKIH